MQILFIPLNPERDAKYRDLAYLITIPIALVSVAVAVWALWVLPIWCALPAAIVVVAFGFVAALKLLNRTLPKKFPTDGAF
ncbi:MAG TPA: hypothetical protein VEJ38_00580 [Candidatus Acidoferrales bacterium]|nr:hypothetical protein [Candidatus Acidoferrales bacterium]